MGPWRVAFATLRHAAAQSSHVAPGAGGASRPACRKSVRFTYAAVHGDGRGHAVDRVGGASSAPRSIGSNTPNSCSKYGAVHIGADVEGSTWRGRFSRPRPRCPARARRRAAPAGSRGSTGRRRWRKWTLSPGVLAIEALDRIADVGVDRLDDDLPPPRAAPTIVTAIARADGGSADAKGSPDWLTILTGGRRRGAASDWRRNQPRSP